jgi:hypothetical protein
VTTSGKHVALSRKFSKELLEDKSEDVKAEIRVKYEKRLKAHKKDTKHGTHALDDDNRDNNETDGESIAWYVSFYSRDSIQMGQHHFQRHR